ncbi:ABC transporter substrate-binding protein [Cohnella nanjingensis]|uniref:ABC transporter substrate-binding protein n=1 Tax=Cohnella nanjingensis TaxID=1387779 RepID=A0A7X0RWU4_9BACL|nr:ABC transporter substrate-binding protein [Cohnella nanjingensis]MBB6675103.1 ABC transporter substrate-binding protein [Cohnella nanjingensis]
MNKTRYGKAALSGITLLLATGMVLSGCGGNGDKNASSGGSDNGGGAGGKKSKVTVWYLWGGKEGQVIEDVIKRFNDSQDKITVEGLSVPDEQKIKVAIAGGKGPDLTDSFASNVAQYAKEGIALPLEDLIARDKYDMSDFVPATLEQGKYDGKLFALPLNINMNGMFYNKKLLADAGYTEPPKTSKELIEMATKLTKTSGNGEIEVLGFPSYPGFPFQALTYGFGGTYVSQDGKKATFDQPGALEALQAIYDYNKQFGVNNIKQVQATGKWLDPTDPFMSGKQAFRFDGPWLSTFMANNNIKLDYGLAPLPYLDGHADLAGSNEAQSSIFYIAKNSKNVDGAWEFMKFMYSAPELAKVMGGMGNIPARTTSMKDPVFGTIADADKFMEFAQNANVKALPNIAQLPDLLNKVVKEEGEAVFNLKKTPEEGIAAMQKRAQELLDK